MNKYLMNTQLLDDALLDISEIVLINEIEQRATITTAYLGVEEKRHISSLVPFRQGDYVEHRGQIYLVMEETETKRHNKYRATMTACNNKLETVGWTEEIFIKNDSFGRPIYDYIYHDGISIHIIVKHDEINLAGGAIRVSSDKIKVWLQDSESNKESVEVNSQHLISGKNYKVTNVSSIRVGLLEVSMEEKAI